MTPANMIVSGLLACILILAPGYGASALPADESSGDITVDIPVVLKSAKVLFDIGRVSYAGDMPVALRFMDIMTDKFARQGVKGQLVAVFYGEAVYLLLNDDAYNARRHVATGNPHKGLVAQLQGKRVRLEVCAAAMKMQNIRNADLLPGVQTNEGANLRMVQLMQEGFVRLQP
ncbi:MAG: DsrE family protein [Desulfovibrionaceae bacterium]|nr:DsrE family protein [Desulfovibrionaceae bacterium]MBF0514263.1 DsrE family protein [Desulfovibrionaceae bacterium]